MEERRRRARFFIYIVKYSYDVIIVYYGIVISLVRRGEYIVSYKWEEGNSVS